MAAAQERAERIRALNDQMRADGPTKPSHNRWFLTPGILALGDEMVGTVIAALQAFSAFTEDNDPHREHDFGSIEVGEERVFWKIDYYDRMLSGGSPDPADPEKTCRVLSFSKRRSSGPDDRAAVGRPIWRPRRGSLPYRKRSLAPTFARLG